MCDASQAFAVVAAKQQQQPTKQQQTINSQQQLNDNSNPERRPKGVQNWQNSCKRQQDKKVIRRKNN